MSKRFIKVEDTLVEVGEEVYEEYYRMARKERYQVERDIEKGTLYYEGFSIEDMTGEEMIADSKQKSVEEQAELLCMIPILHEVLNLLDKDEREMIQLIYFENKSVRYLSRFLHIPETSIRRKHDSVLWKLRHLLE